MVDKEARHLHVTGHWDFLLLDVRVEPLIEQPRPELGVERSTVRDEGAGLCDVTSELLLLELDALGVMDPPGFIVLERIDEPSCVSHFLLRRRCNHLKHVFLGD